MIEIRRPGEAPVPQESPAPQVAVPVQTTIAEVTPRASTGYSRKVPWGVGRIASGAKDMDNYGSTRAAMRDLGLDWEVHKVELYTSMDLPAIDGWRAVARKDTGKVLGIVKGRYVPYQNRSLAEFTDTIVDTSKAPLAGMGTAFDDKRVFTVVRLDDINTPDGGLGSFLITANSHDGTSSLYTTYVNIRWACTNGLVSLSDVAHTVKVRHTGNMEMRMREAQRVMASASTYFIDTTRVMEELLATPVSAVEAERWVRNSIIPTPRDTGENQRAINNAERRQDELLATLRNSENLNDVRTTGWGFVNGVAEWNEWTGSHVQRRTRTAMERLLADTGNDVVLRARDLVLA